MTNQEVIDQLKSLIVELDARLDELWDMRDMTGVPFHERSRRRAQIGAHISSLNNQLMHLELQLDNRELAETLNKSVTPLSAARRTAMNKSLRTVSRSIAATRTFRAALKLAAEIAAAADETGDASALPASATT